MTLPCRPVYAPAIVWFRMGKGRGFRAVHPFEHHGIDRGEKPDYRYQAVDQPDYRGAKEFEIRFENTVNPSIYEGSGFGIENLEWTRRSYSRIT